jgi:uncharacterized protein YkwD
MPVNLFDPNFYRSANSSLGNLSDADAWSHFQSSGLDQGLSFSPFVDLNFYRASNSDLAGYGNRQAYDHLVNNGVAEGRRFSQFFDLNFYRASNNDVAALGNEELFNHLQTDGVAQGRRFSQFFDVNYYLADNPDVAAAVGGNKLAALNHFQLSGLAEGRRFSNAFNVNYYRNANPDLAVAAITSNKQLLEHFETYGVKEGRSSVESFNVQYYLGSNPDLDVFDSYYQAYEHFISSGLYEGRVASNYINSDYAGNVMGTARNIALDSQTVVFRDSIGSFDTSDFYSFNLGAGTTNFSLTLNGLVADADVKLLNGNGEAIVSGVNTGATTETLNIDLQTGTYYIHVYPGVGSGSTNYNLSLSATPVTVVSPSPTPVATESPVPQSPLPQAASSSGNSYIDQVLQLTNAERAKAGLNPLQFNAQLNNAAQSHSQDMALGDYFSHTGSNGSLVSDRALGAGYKYSYVGENIAAGQVTPQEVVEAWMNSPGHKANIMNPYFQEIGIGYYYLDMYSDTGNNNFNHYWTQNFGSTLTT